MFPYFHSTSLQSLPWNDLPPSPASVFSESYLSLRASSRASSFWPHLREFHLIPFLAPYLCSMALRHNSPFRGNYWGVILQFTVNSLNTFFVFSRTVHSIICIWSIFVNLNWISDVIWSLPTIIFYLKLKRYWYLPGKNAKSPNSVASYSYSTIWFCKRTTQEQRHFTSNVNSLCQPFLWKLLESTLYF